MSLQDDKGKTFDIRLKLKLAKKVYELYVGGLSYHASEDELRKLFSKYGRVVTVIIPINMKGQKKGCAFISFEKEHEMKAAIEGLNQTEFMGRKIFVEEKKPFDPNAPRIDRSNPDQPPTFPMHNTDNYA